MTSSAPHENPFLKLAWFEFLVVQTLTLAFFPVSLLVCFVAFGPQMTRDLINALVRDWLQTLLILVVLAVLLLSGVIWGVLSWLA